MYIQINDDLNVKWFNAIVDIFMLARVNIIYINFGSPTIYQAKIKKNNKLSCAIGY